MVSGMGTSVWQATYTTCPNGPGSTTAGVQAQWWPMPLRAMPTPVEASQGVYTNVVNTPLASGTVNLVRQQ